MCIHESIATGGGGGWSGGELPKLDIDLIDCTYIQQILQLLVKILTKSSANFKEKEL